MRLDADEYLTDELYRRGREEVTFAARVNVAGCMLPRNVVLFGRELKHGNYVQSV